MTRGSCVIALIPFSLQWASGQAVNERQFLETLARRVDKVIVFSLRFLGRKKVGPKQRMFYLLAE